jgi:ATP-binding cassette subfamily B protein
MSTPESTRAISQDRKKGKNVSALRGLIPFLKPYKILVTAALFMLTFTAAISLILPLAVRGVVDGFSEDLDILDNYFVYAIFVAGLLAVGSAVRYALVTRLGERVVADIRRAVYDKMIGMSPAFYERIMTGEVLSRITTDTTLILSVIGSYLSYALRNAIMFVGGLTLLFITSANKTSPVNLAVVINNKIKPPTYIIALRSAYERYDPITERINVVSVVILLKTSPVMMRS